MDQADQPEVAYAVPFRFDRDAGTHTYRLTNVGAETVSGVSVTLHGGGVLAASAPATLAPRDAMEVVIAGRDLARKSILVVRWFRPNGVEYLWRVSF